MGKLDQFTTDVWRCQITTRLLLAKTLSKRRMHHNPATWPNKQRQHAKKASAMRGHTLACRDQNPTLSHITELCSHFPLKTLRLCLCLWFGHGFRLWLRRRLGRSFATSPCRPSDSTAFPKIEHAPKTLQKLGKLIATWDTATTKIKAVAACGSRWSKAKPESKRNAWLESMQKAHKHAKQQKLIQNS